MAGGWLHFIDKSNYNVGSFMKEAQKAGVALSVSLETLVEMEWGDRIALLQVGGAQGIKSTVMFAEFTLDRLTGLSAESVKRLAAKFRCSLYDLGGDKVIRLHRALNTGFAYDIDASLRDIANFLINLEVVVEVGVPLLACLPEQIEAARKPLPMFTDLVYRTGYRPFDIAGATERIAKQRNFNRKRRPRLGGQWEPAPSDGKDKPLKPFTGDIESAVIIDLTEYLPVDKI